MDETVTRRVRIGRRLALVGMLLALCWSWTPPPLAAAEPPVALTAAAERPVALTAAALWLRAQQNSDGGYGSPTSDGSTSTDVALALASAGVDLASVRVAAGPSLLDYLRLVAPTYSSKPVAAAKLTLTVLAINQSPRSFGGVDLITAIGVPSPTGQLGQSLYEHLYCVLALSATGSPVPATAITYLTSSQISDGSWGFAGPGQPGDGDTNTTSMALQVLAAVDLTAHAASLERGLAYLKSGQTADSGFTYAPTPGEPADANSTALAIQALLALGNDPVAPAWRNPSQRLSAFQNATGAFRWKDDTPADNLFATVQAVPALAGYYLPLRVGAATGSRWRRLAARPLASLPPDSSDRRSFTETGHTLNLGFKYYWETNGGAARFGLPLTEEFSEFNPADGQRYTVQYFERARFEYHPEHKGTPFEVQLGLLGRQATEGRVEPAFTRQAGAPAGCRFFAETGHGLCGDFEATWTAHGGLTLMGLPVSELFIEGTATVQYFERARLERRGGTMSLGLLGRELLYP